MLLSLRPPYWSLSNSLYFLENGDDIPQACVPLDSGLKGDLVLDVILGSLLVGRATAL